MSKLSNKPEPIQATKINWQQDDQGGLVPVSATFGDVYYSLADGLAESRYVFLKQNKLPQRFTDIFQQYLKSLAATSSDADIIATEHLTPANSFTIAELGFGTGLNILATWQLWHELKHQLCQLDNATHNGDIAHPPLHYAPRLHLISTEKYPLSFDDLTLSLNHWKQRDTTLVPFIETLLSQYPTLVSGCHRLHLADDVTLDLWLGDATESLKNIASSDNHFSQQARIDAWYLDGFAPSCNESLWAEQVFQQVQRLSKANTTAATFSCAGVVKRGLQAAGFELKKVKGFGRKREMLTATKLGYTEKPINTDPSEAPISHIGSSTGYQQVAVVGAGISGLMAAWSLAQRGLKVTLIDKTAPLAGASGNPRALLAPKMTPIAHVAEHLHSIGYLYSKRLYRQLDRRNQLSASNDKAQNSSHSNGHSLPSPIYSNTGAVDLLLKANVDVSQIAEYPQQMATTLVADEASAICGLKQQDLTKNLYLPQAGLVNPKALTDTVLSHPNISLQQAEVKSIKPSCSAQSLAKRSIQLEFESAASSDDRPNEFDAVVIAAAYNSQSLDSRIFEFRRIRGQLSWFQPTKAQLEALPKLPLKYGGYCASFIPVENDEQVNPVSAATPTFLLGASFVRNDLDTEIRTAEHEVNHHKLITAIPELDSVLSDSGNKQPNYSHWQARVGIRAQTPDYHPLVGQIDEEGLIWTISGMGSKGYAFAPICAEVLADMMTGQYPPLPSSLLDRLSPHRKVLQKPLPQ